MATANNTNMFESKKATPSLQVKSREGSYSSFNALSILHHPFLSLYEKLHFAQIAMTSKKMKERSEDVNYSSRLNNPSNYLKSNRNINDVYLKDRSRISTTDRVSKCNSRPFKFVCIKECQNRINSNEKKTNASIIFSVFETLKNNLRQNEANQLLITQQV